MAYIQRCRSTLTPLAAAVLALAGAARADDAPPVQNVQITAHSTADSAGVTGFNQPLSRTPIQADVIDPKTLADWGLALERRQVQVETTKFQTSVPGLFAIGDVVHYPGKQRLILSAFHEATLAAAGVAGHLIPGDDGPLEYTTSSPRIHKLLGV